MVSKVVAWAALSARTRAPRSKFRQISPNFAHLRTDGPRCAPRRVQTDPPRVRDGLGIVYHLLGHPGTSHRALYHLFTPGYCSHTHFAKISRDEGGYGEASAQNEGMDQLSSGEGDPPMRGEHGAVISKVITLPKTAQRPPYSHPEPYPKDPIHMAGSGGGTGGDGQNNVPGGQRRPEGPPQDRRRPAQPG